MSLAQKVGPMRIKAAARMLFVITSLSIEDEPLDAVFQKLDIHDTIKALNIAC